MFALCVEKMNCRRRFSDRIFMGSIDKKSVAALAEEILEGGKEAFVTRQKKYNF